MRNKPIFLYIAITLFIGLAVLPLAAGLVYALLYSLGIVGALSEGFTLNTWLHVLTDSNLWISLGLSTLLAVVVVTISTALALSLLIAFRPQLEKPRMRFLLHFPLAIPPIVAAFVSFQWLGSSGMLARAAHQAGWLDNPDNFPTLINDSLYLGVGMTMMLTTFPFLLLIFLNHYEAACLAPITQLAATLGAPAAYIRRRVVIPILLRRVTPTLLLYGVFLFGAYEAPLLLGRQNPAMISMFIHQKFRRFNLADLPAAYAVTVIYALLVMLGIVVLVRKSNFNRRGLSA